MTLTQTTVGHNFADGNGIGGGIYLSNLEAVLDRCTVANNNAYRPEGGDAGDSYKGGGIYASSANPASVYLHDTVVANNYRGYFAVRDDIYGKVNINSRANWISTESAMYGIASGNNENYYPSGGSGADPGLEDVSTTLPAYYAPKFGSFLINAGDDQYATFPHDVDGRDLHRVVDGRLDIGAIEYQPGATNMTYHYDPTPGNPSEVTIFVTVTGAAANSNTPTGGDVRFYLNDYDNVLGFQTLQDGTAALTVPDLQAGTVGVLYSGNDLFSSSGVEFPYSGGPVSPPPPGVPPVSPPPMSPPGVPPVSPPPLSPPGTPPLLPPPSTPPLLPPPPATPVIGPVLVGSGAGGSAALVTSTGAVTPFDSGVTGGVRVASADFNGDGVADLVVGTGPGGATHVRVLDGKTRAELFAVDPFEAAFTGGVFVAAGDVTGDGRADLVITPDEGGGPRARVFSGNGFGQVADFFGIDDPNFRGGARAAVGDVTGDGVADLLIAAGFGGGPRLAVFDGTSVRPGMTPTKPVGDFFVFEQSLRNGVYVAAGDLTGDGYADVVAGGGPGGAPRVFALSGKDLLAGKQTVVANFFAGNTDDRGGVRAAVRDVDGDGRADLIAGAGEGSGSRVRVYPGTAFPAGGTPSELADADAFPGSLGGVYVG